MPALPEKGTTKMANEAFDGEMYCPSVDVCGYCGDSECDGIGCIAALDPNDVDDHPAIEELHSWLRRGRLYEQTEKMLAWQENRAFRREGAQ